jgi:hypothetical protein
LAGPDTLQDPAVVSKNRVENPETAPSGQDTLGDDSPNARDLLTQAGLGQRCDGRGVYVAMGKMPEEVSSGPDAEAFQ